MSTGTLQSRTSRLAAVVRRVRLSFVATVLAAGLLLAVAIALAWVLGGVILDLAVPLSVPGRVVVWCGWWAAVVAACVAFLLVPAARRPLVDAIALKIERALGGIHNRLLTVVDLARRGGSPEGFRTRDGRDFRPDLVERLLDQTQERLRGFRVSRVLPWRAVLRNLFIAAACAALMAALFLGYGERFLITLQRLLTPTADIPPATWLQLAGPGDVEVLEGEPFEIEGRVVRSTADEIELVLYGADGRASRQPMQAKAAGSFAAALEGLDRPVRYRLEGGNTWTKTHDIRILKRPEIRSLVRRVRLPDYMRIDAPLPVADDAAQIRAPAGAAVEFEAVASAEAATGHLKLFTRTLESRVVERFDERIWFEDDLPRDSVAETPWKWTTAQAAGGLRSFTFAADGRPLAMRTRLDRLVLPRDRLESRAFMVMVRSDAADPPGRLSLLLEHDRGRTELVWGDVAAAPPVSAAARVSAGPLPPPGDWARLTVPMKLLAGIAGQAVGGMTVSVDRGRLLLDRPGWVERSEEVVKQPVDHPAGEISLARVATTPNASAESVAADTPWLGRVPVEKPLWTTIEFRSPQGHPNLPSPAVEILPTVDRPPSIVVDNTSETVTLKVADDVPLRGRGFDDWGIDELSVIIGPDPEHLGPPLPVPGVAPADRPPSTQLTIATALTPDMLGIGPGKSAAWKLRIRDTKGQIAETKVFRVTVMMPPESELAKTQVPALAQAKREAEYLAKEAEKKAHALDEKQESVRKAVAEQEKPDRGDVEDITRKLDQEKHDAEKLSKTLSKAAEQAAKSELVPETQKQALTELARKAQALEEQLAGKPQPETSPQPDPAAQEKPAAAPDAKPESNPADNPPQTPAQSQAQKAEAEKAERAAAAPKQQEVAQAAKEIARELENVEQRLNAAGAALQLESLAKDLERRAEDLATQPPAAAADDAAKQQTRSQVRDVEQILGQKFPEPKQQPQPKSDAADGPRPEAAAESKPPAAADAAAKADAAKPGQAAQSEPKPATQPSAPPTAAEAAAQAASETAAAATQLADKLAGKPEPKQTQPNQPQTGTPPPPDATAAAQPTPPATAAAAGTPTTSETSATEPPATAAEIQALLESKEVEQALAMAERAQRLQARAAEEAARAAARDQAEKGRQPGDAGRRGADGDSRQPNEITTSDDKTDPAGRSEGGAVASRGDIDAAELLRGLDAKQRAALYKLPPRIRDPLLEGMRQRGPAAYQNVIDTYFRQLGKDIPQ